jgi:uroporphyrinogen-III synthase
MTIRASNGGIGGLAVMAFESRRAAELEGLIRRHGGVPLVVPSMREVPLEDKRVALELLRRLEAGEVDMVVMMTGVGVRTLADTLAERCSPERLAASLQRAMLVARGPKPIAELRKLGLTPQIRVPEPNTWREILSSLDAHAPVRDRRVAILEYGVTNEQLIAQLEARGAEVFRVPLYRWALPEDMRPLQEAVSRLASEGVDFVLFTSRRQVEHVMRTARELNVADAVLDRVRRLVVVASIGPVCSDALRGHGLPVDVEPEHPKMGQLVVAVARRGRELLEAKRAGSQPSTGREG